MKTVQQLLIFILFSFFFISCVDKKNTVNYYFDAANWNDKTPIRIIFKVQANLPE